LSNNHHTSVTAADPKAPSGKKYASPQAYLFNGKRLNLNPVAASHLNAQLTDYYSAAK
jgi:hypothetical protein